MKTKVIEYTYRIQDGGAETLIKDYACLLDKENFEVTVLCCDIRKDSANYKILKENNIKVVALYEPYFTLNKILARLVGQRFISRLLRKNIIALKPDVIHIHLDWLETFTYCLDCLKDVRLFYTCHNVPKTLIGEDRPKENKACKLLIEKANLKLIALETNMAKELNEMFKVDNTAVINNGINFKEFLKSNKTKAEIRASINIAEDAYLIGHVGRFTYQKNHEKIIDIFNEAVKLNNNAHLLLIGSGSELVNVEKKISEYNLKDKVTILNNRSDVSELLSAMDVFLFPSRYEGISIALIEAQARNLPCVVSNKINRDTYLTDKICELDLDDDNKKWASMCLSPISNIHEFGDLDKFDLSKEIHNLEKLYISK